MSTSKLMAQRFVIDLSSMALGMWETARLLSKKKTAKEGREKLQWLKKKIASYKQHIVLGDSLKIYLNKDFDSVEYDSLIKQLENGKIKEAFPKIEELIKKTQGYINEARRDKTNFKRTF